MNPPNERLEARIGLTVLVILLAGCVLVMRPFLSAGLWAVVLTFSTWPLYRRLLGWLGGRRTLAAALMTLGMVLVILLPFLIIGLTMADNVKELSTATKSWFDEGPPGAPEWLKRLPLVGQTAAAQWTELAGDGAKLLEKAREVIEPVSSQLLKGGLALGRGLLELALSIFIAFFLFRDGAAAAEHLTSAVRRIGAERGQHLLEVAGNTVRGVVYGILGTAIVQSAMAGVGFLIAGVPGALLLGFLTFFLSVIPMGPPLIWIPATIWLFNHGSVGWGIFMAIWGMGVSSIDNFVRPWLISQGSSMPFILIFFGVIGGALAFGFIGVFLGPTLLAVGFRLLQEWREHAPKPAQASAPAAPEKPHSD